MSASHWIFVYLSMIQNQEKCFFFFFPGKSQVTRVWIQLEWLSPLKLVNILGWEAAFHSISAVPMKQYKWSFSSPKALFLTVICTMLERMFFFVCFFLFFYLIAWLALFWKALTNLTRWEPFVGETAGTYGHCLSVKMYWILKFCHNWAEPHASRLLTFFTSCQ